MIEKSLEWGEDYQDKDHSWGYSCINDECSQYFKGYFDKDPFPRNIVIGVRTISKKHISNNPNKDYALTCECPKCHIKYWFHVTEKEAIKVTEYHKSKLEKSTNL